jgi:hypothetical protein
VIEIAEPGGYWTADRTGSAAISTAIHLRIYATYLANLQFIAFAVQSETAEHTFSSTGHGGPAIGENQ